MVAFVALLSLAGVAAAILSILVAIRGGIFSFWVFFAGVTSTTVAPSTPFISLFPFAAVTTHAADHGGIVGCRIVPARVTSTTSTPSILLTPPVLPTGTTILLFFVLLIFCPLVSIFLLLIWLGHFDNLNKCVIDRRLSEYPTHATKAAKPLFTFPGLTKTALIFPCPALTTLLLDASKTFATGLAARRALSAFPFAGLSGAKAIAGGVARVVPAVYDVGEAATWLSGAGRVTYTATTGANLRESVERLVCERKNRSTVVVGVSGTSMPALENSIAAVTGI